MYEAVVMGGFYQMTKLNGKVAVITGASKGIGAGIAKGFGAAGASVVVNYASDREGAERVVAEIRRGGSKAIAIRADVSKPADVRNLFSEANKAFGRVDILVNNAAVFKLGPVESITEEEFYRHYGTNVLGMFLTIQEAIAQFGPEGGNIINVTSSGITATGPMTSLYMSTKGAIATLSQVLAKELAPRNIRVNALAPGMTDTEGVAAIGLKSMSISDELIAQVPMGRWGTPEDIAPVAVFLASDDAQWITGEVMYASGGMR
jgi:3-oxoacyl-[acyl-carrier protein] reductase